MLERYDCGEISRIWSDNNRYLLWTTIELAFLKSYKGITVSPPDIFLDEWIQKIQENESVSKHDVGAFVEWMEKDFLYPLIGAESRWVHYGLTSSDILDTCFSLQIQAANTVIYDLTTIVSLAFYNLAAENNSVDILGRTHGQAAEAMKLSNKFFAYSDALDFFHPSPNGYYGRLAGSVGDYKYFDKKIEEETLYRLGLQLCPVKDGQIIHRAVYAEYMNEWALLASVVEKIATDIRLLSQTEIGEVYEGFSGGQMGSSSMPHKKRNPIGSENLCGLARVIRGYQATSMQNIALWNERDISNSSVERVIFPDATVLLGFMLKRLTTLAKDLVIDQNRMEYNITQQGSSILSQKEMLGYITEGMSRDKAHDLMRDQTKSV